MTLSNLILHVGCTVWFYCSIDGSCRRGTVVHVFDNADGVFAQIAWSDGGESNVPEEHIFKTEKECRAYITYLSDLRKEDYAKAIVTFKDLFNFCIEIMGEAEDPDYDAIEVAKLKFDEITERFNSNMKVTPRMTTPVDDLTIDADGMRKLIDAYNKILESEKHPNSRLLEIQKICDEECDPF